MQMWYPKNGDTDYLSMQVLDVKPNEIAARITMRLQIGVYENATIHEWNMKVATKFVSLKKLELDRKKPFFL